jgi:hypothetical protein
LGDDLGVGTFFGVVGGVFAPSFFGLDFGELGGFARPWRAELEPVAQQEQSQLQELSSFEQG